MMTALLPLGRKGSVPVLIVYLSAILRAIPGTARLATPPGSAASVYGPALSDQASRAETPHLHTVCTAGKKELSQ
ncbi:hypothetical protein BGZ63DRAFT_372752 [Mariannaea sp. PMI_226]|nr:hypothetical protein BGZ63DRAFT_372752 [Mariannaea sp. PMI_226]